MFKLREDQDSSFLSIGFTFTELQLQLHLQTWMRTVIIMVQQYTCLGTLPLDDLVAQNKTIDQKTETYLSAL